MATRTKSNWKVLDRLLPIFEKEGWSHAQVASDWGISLATLEGHLDQQEGLMAPPRRYIDWQRFDELKAQGLPLLRISAEMGIPEATLRQSAQRRDKTHQSTPEAHHNTPKAHPRIPEEPELSEVHPGTPEPAHVSPDEQYTQTHPDTLSDADPTEVHHGTLEGHQEVMEDISQSVPDAPHIGTEEPYQSTPEHPSTPEVHQELSPSHSSVVHSGVPARQEWPAEVPAVHPGTPTAEDWELWNIIKARWLEVEKMLAERHIRQALLSTPTGTPRHTVKKTYVVDTFYVELIDRYAKEHSLDLKDVLNFAFHRFFEQEGYLRE
jgi:lambda repressor-like predicted transcriptional regulator